MVKPLEACQSVIKISNMIYKSKLSNKKCFAVASAIAAAAIAVYLHIVFWCCCYDSLEKIPHACLLGRRCLADILINLSHISIPIKSNPNKIRQPRFVFMQTRFELKFCLIAGKRDQERMRERRGTGGLYSFMLPIFDEITITQWP